jgi:Ca2+-binding RTX toxin-like protein
MSAFVFETITPAEAAAYSGAADSLNFQTQGLWAALASVAYQTGADGSPQSAAVSLNGQVVMFGAGVFGDQDIRFADGSMLYIGAATSESMSGTALSDALFGGQGDDTLAGGAGNDFLQGNQGGDSLAAAAGDDFSYGGQGDDVIDVGEGLNFAQGNLGNDTVSAAGASGRNTILGGQGDDVVIGGSAADFLNGNLGADSISGGAGEDTLSGEGGADSLAGGEGADLFVFAAGSSSTSIPAADFITDWSGEDRIDVPGNGGPGAYYLIPPSVVGGGGGDPYGYGEYEPTPTTVLPIPYATALSRANSWIRDHPSEVIVTAQVAEGVAIFVDTNGDRTADLSIILVGKTVFDVSGFNFI